MDSLQRTILIVDDNAEDRGIFRRYLEREHEVVYLCHEASTAAQGAAMCRSLRPDAILLDYSLPDENGLVFLQALLAEHGPLAFAVVMLTGAGNETVAVQTLKLGAQDYLVKEYDIKQRLVVAMANAINKVQLQRQIEQQRHDLETNHQHLHMALQAARMAIWEWDLATNQVRWSKDLESMMGMAAGTFASSFAAFAQLVHPDDAALVQQRLDQAMRGDAVYDIEFRMLRPDGSLRWTATRGAVVRDQAGTPIRVIGVDMDVSERKQAEVKLRASEERSRLIWASASDAMVLSDAEGNVLDANRAYCDLYGYTPEQVIGHSFAIIFSPDQRALAVDQYREIMRTRVVLPTYESTVRRSNGDTRIVESRADFVVTSDGLHALLSIIRDITVHRQTTDHLRRSESQFKTLVEHAPDIITRFDRELRHLYVSPAVERASNLAPATYIGKTNREMGMPDELCDLWEHHLHTVFATGNEESLEFTYLSSEGPLYYQSTLIPELAADGTVETVMSIARDVTGYKYAEERMRFISEASKVLTASLDYQTILDQIVRLAIPYLGDACIIDLVGDNEISNTVVAHTDPQQEALLRDITGTYAPKLDSAHPVAQVLRTRQPIVLDQIPQELIEQTIPSTGHRTLVQYIPPQSCMMVPLAVRDQTIGVIALYATQAPRRYTVADLETLEELARRAAMVLDNAQLYQEAQEAIRERDAFLAIASHEVKNPLTALLGRTNLLQMRLRRRDDSARELNDTDIIMSSGQRINQLLTDMLDASKVASGQLHIEPVRLDLGPLIQRVVDQLQPFAPTHRITLTGLATGLAITGDASRLEQVFQNLISNAIKYSPEGGTIAVEIGIQDARARITVRDEGLGIPAAALPHLFKRFYRVNHASTQEIGGSGIGLYVVKEIVTSHGGTVEVSSTEGEGSAFTVYLPYTIA